MGLSSDQELTAIPPDGPSRPGTPVNCNQIGFWTLEQLESPVNAWRLWKIEGALDPDAMKRACCALVDRHQLLRSCFQLRDGQMMQEPADGDRAFYFDTRHFQGTAGADDDARADAIRAAGQPFDLRAGPVIRFHLWQTGAHRFWLLIVAHHIVVDGWSWGVLHRDLSRLYGKESVGAADRLPAMALSFRDIVERERLLHTSADLQARLAQACEELRGVPDLELPRDRAVSAASRRVGRHRFSIPAAQTQQLRHIASDRQVTDFAVWLAVFALCLARQTGQSDFALGVAAANRGDPDSKELVCPLATVVPVRLRMADSRSFDDLLTQASRLRKDVQARQGQPFDWYTQKLDLHSQQGRPPLVQAMLSYRNMPDDGLTLDGLVTQLEPLDAGIESSPFELTLEVVPGPGATDACMVYRIANFDEASIALVAQRLERVVGQICADPTLPLQAYCALGIQEEQSILHKWASPLAGGRHELSVHEAFARQVSLRPDSVAVIAAGRSVRYHELDLLSDRVRSHLLANGVRGGAIVGVVLAPGIHYIAALLGILKSGAAYLPIDPADPAERIDALLRQCGCGVTVGSAEQRGRIQERVLFLCADDLLLAAAPAFEDMEHRVTGDSPAYIMFTSGSTGVPKGVVTPHRAIVRLAVDPQWVDLRPSDVFLLQSTASFDGATLELWGALLNGACLVIPPARLLNCHEMQDTLRANGVTVLFLTTSVYNMFASEDIECLQGLRLLLVGGEAINAVHVRTGLEHLRGCRIINGYGPTENTTFTCTHEVSRVEPGRPIPIGRPIDRTSVYILGPEQEIMPVGVPGELHAGGDGLALGYVGDANFTREKFIEVAAEKLGRVGAPIRLYRTGDLARWRPDGLVEFLGRADRQVKLRGFRIELGEIETILLNCPGVRQAVARLWESAAGPRLVAYTSGDLAPDALRRWVKARLPAWMVPDDFIPVSEIPLRPTGKIDMTALPLPELARVDRPPRQMTAFEQRVAAAMAAVLNCGEVGPDDDFHSLGGNSLRAIQFLGRLERDFGRRVAAADFLQHPTVAQAASLLAQATKDEFPEEIEVLRRGTGGAPIFFAHSIAGSSLYARAYVPYLPPSTPVYGLRMSARRALAPTSLETLAADHVQAIRAVQPEGPYHLAGYSFGAHLAFEIARQLSVAGDRLGVLAIIDSTPMFEEEALHMGADLPGTPESDCKRMLADYRHSALGAQLLFFRSESPLSEALLQPDGGWELFARDGVETLRLPGDHAAAVREPAARLIGERISLAMAHTGDAPAATPEPSAETAWKVAAIMLARERNPAALLEHYRARVRESKALPPWAIVEYADLCTAACHVDELDDLLNKLESERDFPQAHAFALALARSRQGRPEMAAQLFERAAVGGELALGPLLHLAQLGAEPATPEVAIGYAQRATVASPNSTAARRALADALLAANRKVEALHELDAAIAIDGSDAQLRYQRSQVLAGLGRLQLAREDARAAVLLCPAEPRYRAHLESTTADIEHIAHGEIVMTAVLPEMHAGERVQFEVEVRNHSGQAWRATWPDAVLLSYHWTLPDGTSHVHDGIRSRMPAAIEPGGRLTVRIDLLCPREPGPYWLELTAVQENVVWFESSSLFIACRLPVVLGL